MNRRSTATGRLSIRRAPPKAQQSSPLLESRKQTGRGRNGEIAVTPGKYRPKAQEP